MSIRIKAKDSCAAESPGERAGPRQWICICINTFLFEIHIFMKHTVMSAHLASASPALRGTTRCPTQTDMSIKYVGGANEAVTKHT